MSPVATPWVAVLLRGAGPVMEAKAVWVASLVAVLEGAKSTARVPELDVSACLHRIADWLFVILSLS